MFAHPWSRRICVVENTAANCWASYANALCKLDLKQNYSKSNLKLSVARAWKISENNSTYAQKLTPKASNVTKTTAKRLITISTTPLLFLVSQSQGLRFLRKVCLICFASLDLPSCHQLTAAWPSKLVSNCRRKVIIHQVRAGVTNMVPAGTRSPARTMWVARRLVLTIA